MGCMKELLEELLFILVLLLCASLPLLIGDIDQLSWACEWDQHER